MSDLDARLATWRDAWPPALEAWSRYTRLRDARLCASSVAAAKHGLTGSFAMIRLIDKSVVIDLEKVAAYDLDGLATEILAHEIGHHVLAPATVTDNIRLLARLRAALPTLERHAPMVANLYTDLLINDRLQRQAGLRMVDVYRHLIAHGAAGETSRLWTLYVGIYEVLWSLERGGLGGPRDDPAMQGDAWLGARVVRVYAGDWLTGAGRFASLVLPYLAEDVERDAALHALHDTATAAAGADPVGAQTVEADEADGAIHPSRDPRITGCGDGEPPAAPPSEEAAAPANRTGQAREPFEYGELLRAAGLDLSDEEIAVRYYRERALPHLVTFPTLPAPQSEEPQLEGLEPWSLGDPLDEVDWLQTAAQSPVIVPGVTTVRRVYGREPGPRARPEPIDLDVYVDSSGSMPDPRRLTSYLTLAGTIIALSALKTGARVQATLWSDKAQWMGTQGFVRDETAILRILCGYFGGGTAFPIHRLRDTFANFGRTARPTHILLISDDGITTMFDQDERGNSGWDVAAAALGKGRAGGTMALNLAPGWDSYTWSAPIKAALDRAATEQGWAIDAIAAMPDLVAFARGFSRRHYGKAPA